MPKIPFSLSLFWVTISLVRCESPSVHISNLGTIQGYHEQSYNGKTIFSFEGVPYARPPVGKYRFREPQPVKPWKGVWEAKTIYKCMQYNQYTPPGHDYVVGDEDCLYLNIYSPNLDHTANLDVLVYIHGGSFMFNYGGIYRPQFLLDENLILITLNYRLGPLGFLSTEDNTVPGNNGLKDQIQALTFIKNHISHFGGNPNSITIMGNSAGGVSVHFHYLSEKSRGLFQRGLSISGTTLVPWALMEQPMEKTKRVAANVGCGGKSTEKLVECLKRRPARQIVASVKEFQPWLYIPFSPFGMVVDTWSKDPVLPQHPYELLRNGKVLDVPWVASYTNSEGLYPAEEFYQHHLDDVDSRWNDLMPLILDYNYTVQATLHDEVSDKIRRHFLGSSKLSKASFREFVPILSQRLFVNDIQKAVGLQAAVSTSVYCYKFGYRGQNSWFMFEEDGKNFGAAHADDIPYILKMHNLDTRSNQADRDMSEFLVKMVVNFAKTGEPGVDGWGSLSPGQKAPLSCLNIASHKDASVKIEAVENEEFWASLPIRENEKLVSGIKDEL